MSTITRTKIFNDLVDFKCQIIDKVLDGSISDTLSSHIKQATIEDLERDNVVDKFIDAVRKWRKMDNDNEDTFSFENDSFHEIMNSERFNLRKIDYDVESYREFVELMEFYDGVINNNDEDDEDDEDDDQ
jgi:hypothetical protein